MKFAKSFQLGIHTYSEAHKLIIKHRLWGYVLLPGLINLLLFVIIFWAGFHFSGKITSWFFDFIGISSKETGLSFFYNAMRFLVRFLVQFMFIYMYLFIYKYIVLMIMSPILAILSEKTDMLITGKHYPFSLKQLIKDILRGNCIVLRNMMIELLYVLLFFLLGFIPVLGLLSPLVLFIISMYFYGFSMIDYSSERYRFSIAQSVIIVRKNKGFAVANGMIFYGLLLVPVLGLLIAPTYAVVAATICFNKISNNTQTVEKK